MDVTACFVLLNVPVVSISFKGQLCVVVLGNAVCLACIP